MKKDNLALLCKSAITSNMALRGDDVTPELKMSQFWHETFDDIFQDFNPDEWTLEPTNDRGMPRDWRRFKDSAKVKFLCENCGNSWTSMMGRIIFWYKKIDQKDNKKELKTEEEKCTSDEGQKDEPKGTNKCKKFMFRRTKILLIIYHTNTRVYSVLTDTITFS